MIAKTIGQTDDRWLDLCCGLAAFWLVGDGKFVANLDATNMCLSGPGKGHLKMVRFLLDAGFESSCAGSSMSSK